MPSLGQILSRTFFWSYERGTWQYDLAVILILVFVLLTPRNWFRDKPQSGAPVTPGQVQFISKEGNRLTYRVDARILAPPTRLALQNDLHTALQEALPELGGSHAAAISIEDRRTDRMFKLADATAQRRLFNSQGFCGASKATVIRCGNGTTQMLKIDCVIGSWRS